MTSDDPTAVPAAEQPSARQTLGSGSRIRRGAEIRRVFDQGRSAADGPVVVYAFDRADEEPPRYGLVVGRKWGKANRRNRVRRLLREAFRTSRIGLPAGFDFLLLPRDPLHELRMPAVRASLSRAALRAVKRCGEPARPRRPGPPRKRRRR